MNLKIAQLSDIEALNQLVNSAYRGEDSKQGWTSEADLLGGQRTDMDLLKQEISDPKSVILIFQQSETSIAGCVLLKNLGTKAYLGMLTIAPDQQALGLGKKLLHQGELWVQQNWQLNIIEMTVISLRTELLQWYRRRGYIETEEKQAFPYGDIRFGQPKVDNLEFIVLRKTYDASPRLNIF